MPKAYYHALALCLHTRSHVLLLLLCIGKLFFILAKIKFGFRQCGLQLFFMYIVYSHDDSDFHDGASSIYH